MWLLLLINAINALLSNDIINSPYTRLKIGSFPANVIDVLIVLGVILLILPKRETYFRTERFHPGMRWAAGLFTAAIIGAGIAALVGNAPARAVITTSRNLLEVPLLMFIGYGMISRPGVLPFYYRFLCYLGFCSAVVILLTFGGNAEELSSGGDIINIRVVSYVSDYAGIAAALFLFSLGSGAKPIHRAWLAVPLAAVCFVGQFATLARSDWLALIAGIMAAVVMMPKYRFRSKLVFAFAVVPIMSVVLLSAIMVASKISGKDVGQKMILRVESLLPGEHEGVKVKAWDTRTGAAVEELKLWIRSPIVGGGFGIHEKNINNEFAAAFRHNTWTSTLAESGIIGFSAMALMCIGQVVVGRRMVKQRLDRGSVLIGGMGVITGVHFIILSYCTMSFNQVRWAIPVATSFGVVMRCRAIQRAVAYEYEGYLLVEEQAGDSTPLLADYDSAYLA
jgi:hypothetical protein